MWSNDMLFERETIHSFDLEPWHWGVYFVNEMSDTNRDFRIIMNSYPTGIEYRWSNAWVIYLFIYLFNYLSVAIPRGPNCAPLLAYLILYSYEAEFVKKLLRDNKKKLVVSFNYKFRYKDNVLSFSIVLSQYSIHIFIEDYIW
jgi:hypothetical protein